MRIVPVQTIARAVFAGALCASTAATQSTRQSLDGAWAIRISAGPSVPVGREQLAVAWSAGPALAASLERYLADPQTTREFSLGAFVAHSVHPFDERGFQTSVRRSGAIPVSAAGASASMTTVAGVARLATPLRFGSPFFSVTLGYFQSEHGNVTFTTASSSGVVAAESKNGFLFGLGLGVDAGFRALAMTLEGGMAMGVSGKDEPEGIGQLTCDRSGCGVPKKRTQIVSLRAGVRWARPRRDL